MAEQPNQDGGDIDLDQVSRDIWRLVPNIEDFDRLNYVMRPYVMRLPAANYQSRSLNTDAHGFRRLVKDGGIVTFDQFRAASGAKGILCGDSTVFGYGLADDESIQALLSRRNNGEALWYSLAAPVANILQSRLTLELFLPANIDHVVLVVSTMAPVMYLLTAFGMKPYPALFGQATDAAFGGGAGGTQSQRRFKLKSGIEVNDPQTAFQSALDDVRKNLLFLAVALRGLTRARLLVCFRASPIWMGKTLVREERELMALFVQKHQTHIALTSDPELQPYWMKYVASVAEICRTCKCDFIDFNQIAALKAPEWLFFDQFHPNAKGTALLAQAIGEWADQTTDANQP